MLLLKAFAQYPSSMKYLQIMSMIFRIALFSFQTDIHKPGVWSLLFKSQWSRSQKNSIISNHAKSRITVYFSGLLFSISFTLPHIIQYEGKHLSNAFL